MMPFDDPFDPGLPADVGSPAFGGGWGGGGSGGGPEPSEVVPARRLCRSRPLRSRSVRRGR